MWRISAIIIASFGSLFAVERTCTAISSHLTNRIILRNFQAGDDWVDYNAREPLMWLPRRARSLLWPLSAVREALLDSLAKVTALKSDYLTMSNAARIIPAGLLIFTFTAARVFLVLEAFISFRSMNPRVYDTPNWPQWFPHL
jgi:hypothetical protein